MSRIVNKNHFHRLKGLIAQDEVILGGRVDEGDRFIEPTLLLVADPARSKAMEDEIFGPILPIVVVDDMDAAVNFVNAREKPLALYVFTSSASLYRSIISRTCSGGVAINDVAMHYFVPGSAPALSNDSQGLPFGGVGHSGCGAYHGKRTLTTFTHKKGVFVNSTAMDPPVRYPPYTPFKQNAMRKMLSIRKMPSLSGAASIAVLLALLFIFRADVRTLATAWGNFLLAKK
jgi:aldehyde dehydrogenase (NAD+)